MKKIITAINNPKLNEELKKESNFEIVGKDIQYKEAILEILEKNNKIDLIIISENIVGQISFEELIKKIKYINEKIKLIFILENENNELEKILIKNKVIDIYYNNEINLEELVKIINKKEINMEEEIIKLKKIIEEKNNYFEKNNKNIKEKNKKTNYLKYKKLDGINVNKNKTYKKQSERGKKKNELVNNSYNMSTKIIVFSGNYKSGKSILSLITSHYLSREKFKILLIDADLEKQDLSILFKKHEKCKKKEMNLKNRNKIKKLKNKFINYKNKIKIYKLKKIINLFTTKINKNLYFFKGLNYFIKNQKLINDFFEQLKQKYNFIIIDLSKNNVDFINQEILKRSYQNFIIMEANLFGLKEIKNLLEKYIKKWKVQEDKIHIIINKKNFNSMNKKLISNCIPIKNKILEIKENKILFNLSYQYPAKNYLLNNKKIKNQINKIIRIE